MRLEDALLVAGPGELLDQSALLLPQLGKQLGEHHFGLRGHGGVLPRQGQPGEHRGTASGTPNEARFERSWQVRVAQPGCAEKTVAASCRRTATGMILNARLG